MSILLHIANILLLASFTVRDILLLRLISMAASTCFIFYFLLPLARNPEAAGWNIVFISVNVFQVLVLLRMRSGRSLSPDERWAWEHALRHLEPGRVAKLIRKGHWRTLDDGETLAREGKSVSSLFLLRDGTATVQVRGTTTASCNAGDFIGEMAWVSQEPATATVIASPGLRVLVWSRDTLDALLNRDPTLQAGLQAAIGANLAQKLRRSSPVDVAG